MAAKKTGKQKLEDILKQNQKSISPEGVIAAEKAAQAALERKYPGMFKVTVRRGTAINRGD